MTGEARLLRREGRAHGTSAMLVGISVMCMVASLAGYHTAGLVTAGTFALLALGPPLARRNLQAVVPRLPRSLVTTVGQPARWPLELDTASRTVRDLRVSLDEGRRDVAPLAAGWSAELRGRPAQLELQPRFASRGHRTAVQLELRSAWPLGWLEERRRWSVPADLWVLPRILQLDGRRLVRMESGDERARTRGTQGDIYALREWRSGEDMRQVAWKLSARRGRRLVAERREANLQSLRLHLLLAVGSTPPAHSYPFEAAVCLAASLLAQHARAGAQVELIASADPASGADRQIARHASELTPMLRRLAAVQPLAGDLDAALAAVPPPGPGEAVWAIAAAAAGSKPPAGVTWTDTPEATLEELRPRRPGRPERSADRSLQVEPK